MSQKRRVWFNNHIINFVSYCIDDIIMRNELILILELITSILYLWFTTVIILGYLDVRIIFVKSIELHYGFHLPPHIIILLPPQLWRGLLYNKSEWRAPHHGKLCWMPGWKKYHQSKSDWNFQWFFIYGTWLTGYLW